MLHARQTTQFFTKPDTALSPVYPVKIVNGEMLNSTVFPCRHSDAACQCPNQSSRPADDAPSLMPRPEELLITITCHQPRINSMDGYNDIVLNVNKGVHSYRIKTFVIDQSHHSLVVSLLLASLDQLTRRQSITLSSYHHNAIPKFFPQNNKGDALIKCL